MPLTLLGSFALFIATVFLVGAACAPGPRASASPVVRLMLGACFVLGGMFFAGFFGYVWRLPNHLVAWSLAFAASGLTVARGKAVRALWREAELQAAFRGWLVFATWILGLLALILTYSGGGWAGDWLEHWQRTEIFVRGLPPETRLIELYSLTARPPLANAVIALWLEGAGATFANFQVFMALFSSLVFLPAYTLAKRWSRNPHCDRWLLLVLMLSPFIAQNATFAWTKLPTAFFVLVALERFLHALDAENGLRMRRMASVCLGLALLTHYSAAPWIIAIFAAEFVACRADWGQRIFWREQALAVLIMASLFAPWAGWTISRFGSAEATGSTTTALAWREQSAVERVAVPLRNTIATIVPFLLRGEPDDALIRQESRLGRLRDLAFNLYQINLPLALGLGGLWVLAARLAARAKKTASPPSVSRTRARIFWQVLAPLGIFLGIAVHTPPDAWGLAHICLQPFLVIGLAAVAAFLAEATPSTRRVWALLAAIDVAFGIVLHFTLQSCVLAPGRDIGAFLNTLNAAARTNALGKLDYRLEFLADRVGAPPWLIAFFLATLLAFALRRALHVPLKSV